MTQQTLDFYSVDEQDIPVNKTLLIYALNLWVTSVVVREQSGNLIFYLGTTDLPEPVSKIDKYAVLPDNDFLNQAQALKV